MACFGVANDEIPIRSTITLYSGALPLATGSDISPKCTVPGRQQSLFRELLGAVASFDEITRLLHRCACCLPV